MERLGYPFIATSNPVVNQNGILVASKWQLEQAADQHSPDIDCERWLNVRVTELDLDVLAVHIPGAPDHKFEDGRGISGAKRKELLWERTIKYAVDHKERRAIIMGDFNTGFRIDTEGEMFAMSHYMKYLADIGFVDMWRHLHPEILDYTWYSKRKDKTTGKSHDYNGFRLDYIFVSPALHCSISDVAILHEPRTSGASDHASVVADIAKPAPAATTGTDGSGPGQFGVLVDPRDRPVGAGQSENGNFHARFEITPGSLPDMTCGYNGQDFVHQFRPTHFTAEWTRGVLKEVRIWGPRLLQDGSLGKRLLDHRWKRPVAAGGVNHRDLPPAVAAQLRSYIASGVEAPSR
ncbi:endonuclease/exonuclease/phosphatase [Mycobacterium sp. 852002-51163_SCH5372311]|nr:endonuclease/exonuclease/phosphatase [Mycobacterium sp. 852002-51163_SCH5372311]